MDRVLCVVLCNTDLTYTLACYTRTGYKKRENIRDQRFAPACLHCRVACCALFYNPAIVRRSALLLTFVSSVTADFSIEPFPNGTQDADVCAHRKFRCGRYDVPIRIAIFVDDPWKSRYCPEFFFRAGMRNVIMWKCDKNDTFEIFN